MPTQPYIHCANPARPQGSAAPGPAARTRHRPSRYPVLDAVEQAFARFLADPQAPHVRTVLGTLPLAVVRSILADPRTLPWVHDGIWHTLIGHARGDDTEWLLAAVGCALPRIRSSIWHATRDRRVDKDEAAQAALTAFAEAVLTLDPAPERGVLDDLVRYARNAAQTVADRTQRDYVSHRQPGSFPPPAPSGHPDLVLARLVREGVITAEEADLIGRHRLEGTSIRRLAAARGTYPMRLHRQLQAAEDRVIAALDDQ
jgi:hypothetical protein